MALTYDILNYFVKCNTACISYIRPDWDLTIAIRESICKLYLSPECGQVNQEYDRCGSKCNKAVISSYSRAGSIKQLLLLK